MSAAVLEKGIATPHHGVEGDIQSRWKTPAVSVPLRPSFLPGLKMPRCLISLSGLAEGFCGGCGGGRRFLCLADLLCEACRNSSNVGYSNAALRKGGLNLIKYEFQQWGGDFC
jgi:hypothetical protein